MISVHFIASDKFSLDNLESIKCFVESFSDFQNVHLSNEQELELLFDVLEMTNIKSRNIDNPIFPKIWDLSHLKFPEFNEAQYINFHKKWLEESGRENLMSEYGQLIFLQGLSKKWNQLNFRLVLLEK